jgi:protein-S-isoprenylcysteine O-methyltransferase Ste14
VSLMTLRLAALGALIPVLVAYADAPWRTFGQRYLAHRWPERLVLFSIELNLFLLWALAKLLVGRDAAVAPDSLRLAFAGAGALLAWAAAAFAVWAKLTLGRWFSASFAVKPGHALVTRGPYAIVRHPMVAAFVLLALGLAIAWDSWVTVGFALIYAVPFWMHTAIEEQMLEAHFGDAWRDYRARVPRLLPGWRAGLTATPSPRP